MNNPTTLLTLDTALGGCSVGIFTGTAESGYYEDMAMVRGQAEALLPMLERVREKAGIAYECIDGVAVTCGPGNFTGLRIALTAARTLARLQVIPTYAMSTTHAIAFAHWQKMQRSSAAQNMLVALDTKRGDYYTQSFSHDCVAQEAPVIRTRADLYAVLTASADTVLIGHGLEALIADAPEAIAARLAWAQEDMRPVPAVMAMMCYEAHVRAGVVDDVHPLYLREAETNIPKQAKQ